MGVYDSVMVNCPQCGTSHKFQSKSGENPFCRVFTLEECPEDVLEDVNRHAPCKCDCGIYFEVDLANRVAIVVNTQQTTPFVNRGTLVVSYEKDVTITIELPIVIETEDAITAYRLTLKVSDWLEKQQMTAFEYVISKLSEPVKQWFKENKKDVKTYIYWDDSPVAYPL